MPLSPQADPPEPVRALIPRDVVAAVPAPAPARPPRRAAPPDPSRQLSLFGVESVDASPTDLAGLVAGPGRCTRMGGTARVSVRVDAAWRVHALLAELAARGLEASWLPAATDLAGGEPPGTHAADADPPDTDPAAVGPAAVGPAAGDAGGLHAGSRLAGGVPPGSGRPRDGEEVDDIGDERDIEVEANSAGGAGGAVGFEVRTAYSSMLARLAGAWLDGTAKRAPDRFLLTGPRLRLWAIAAGSPHPGGYDLRLGAGDPAQVGEVVAAALARAGLPGEVSDSATGGRTYRIVGRLRLARLAELVGERPAAAPPGAWPES